MLFTTAVIALTIPVQVCFAGSANAAKSRVMQAADYLEHNRKDDAKDKLDEAEKFLDGLSDDERAPIQKQIVELRAKLGEAKPAGGGGAAPAPVNQPAPAAGADNGAAAGIARNLDRNIKMAQEETNPGAMDGMVEQAQQILDADDAKKNLSADTRAKYQGQIDALRAKMKAHDDVETTRRLTDQIGRMISGADSPNGQSYLVKAHGLLESEDIKQKLDTATLQRLTKQLADTETQIHQRQKQDALSRAQPPMKELEEQVATDPFKGVQSDGAYKVTQNLASLASRVKRQISILPADDTDRKAYEARLAAAQQKVDSADAAWTAANFDAAIQNRWKYLLQDSTGWENEQYAPGPRAFELPRLNKTEKAAADAKYFLEQKETIDARQKGNALPHASKTIAEAEKTQADALAKLDAAFNQWMDAAEKQPRPQGTTRFEIGTADEMARWAAHVLSGFKNQDADVARAKKLDQKWKDELAAIEKEHAAALKKMTADADTAWPGIDSSIHADTGFHPADVSAMKGKTFRFSKIRNRSGWDFDGQYDLVIWVDGQPVAGMFDPKIKKAFDDAAIAIGDSVPDHIDWDVIAVIQGTGSVNQRFTTIVKDEHEEVIAKLEGKRPVDCVIVRVIAIHAGPVAISAK